MRKTITTIAMALVMITALAQQSMNVYTGQVCWSFNTEDLGEMTYSDGTTITILGKTFAIADIDSIKVTDNPLTDGNILVNYLSDKAEVTVAGDIASHITAGVRGAHVTVLQDTLVADEYTYTLKGSTEAGSFYNDGEYKMSLVLDGVSIANPDSAAINILNGKRISVELVAGTVSNLADGANGKQKGCFMIKGHTEFKNGGTLNITGNKSHAFWGKEYVEVKKTAGTINILGAKGDGFNINQYYQQNGGKVTISGVDDDGLQVSFETDDDDVIVDEKENTGSVTVKGGTLEMAITSDGGKGVKAEGDFNLSGGTLTVTQTGNIVVDGDDVNYSTCVKTDGNINITGGTVNITNTAQGGKGLSADGDIVINESSATVAIDIKANGEGGVADIDTSGTEPQASYKLYVSLPTSGGGGGQSSNPWKVVYLYNSDGTLVQKLTNTVTRTAGYSTTTFYYYDFKAPTEGNYYFKADDYTSRNGQTYTIRSVAVGGPDDTDVYYSITNSYDTSGTTRTYKVTDVTSTYGGSSEQSEDEGKGYNASGLKADGDITIGGGTINVENSGMMSKSVKSKGTVTINGGTITLAPSGTMKVISGDASYSTGIKADYYVQNGGSVTITSTGVAGKGVSSNNSVTVNDGTLNVTVTGTGQYVNNARYTAKGLKADGDMALAGGTITVSTTTNGAKAIKVNGAYTQGTEDGNGPTLTLSTLGSRFTNGTSGGGGWGPGGGKTSGQGGAAKALKVMGTLTVYGGSTEVSTKGDGGEGFESKTSVDFRGGQHYFACYDDCIGSNGNIYFNGGIAVAYSNGNDAVDSNAGRAGAITIGNGTIFAYSTKGGAEEGLDCDNNSYIKITGNGIAISAGGSQGGGMGGSSAISGAVQGYYLGTSSISYRTGTYYTLADASGNNLVTYSFAGNVTSSLSLLTATGMVKGRNYTVKSSTTAPTDADTTFHGIYIGSTAQGSTSVLSFTAQ